MRIVLNVLGILWSLPIQVVSGLVFLVCIVSGQLTYYKFFSYPLALVFHVKEGGWLHNIIDLDDDDPYDDILGFAWGLFIAISPSLEEELQTQIIIHERRHTWQAYVCGIFMVTYVLFYIGLRLNGENGYKSNPFEVDARNHTSKVYGGDNVSTTK